MQTAISRMPRLQDSSRATPQLKMCVHLLLRMSFSRSMDGPARLTAPSFYLVCLLVLLHGAVESSRQPPHRLNDAGGSCDRDQLQKLTQLQKHLGALKDASFSKCHQSYKGPPVIVSLASSQSFLFRFLPCRIYVHGNPCMCRSSALKSGKVVSIDCREEGQDCAGQHQLQSKARTTRAES